MPIGPSFDFDPAGFDDLGGTPPVPMTPEQMRRLQQQSQSGQGAPVPGGLGEALQGVPSQPAGGRPRAVIPVNPIRIQKSQEILRNPNSTIEQRREAQALLQRAGLL